MRVLLLLTVCVALAGVVWAANTQSRLLEQEDLDAVPSSAAEEISALELEEGYDFTASSMPNKRTEVTFDSCGQPMCPPRTALGEPPRAYVCDCTSIIPHPDCVPLCSAQKSAQTTAYEPQTVGCKCPYRTSASSSRKKCGCNVVGGDFPISPAYDLTKPTAKQEPMWRVHRAFTPSWESPNPLPSVGDNECRPNVYAVGPGNCRETPQTTSCGPLSSNCQPCPASGGCPVSPLTRTVSCTCTAPPPSPCSCKLANAPEASAASPAAPESSSEAAESSAGLKKQDGEDVLPVDCGSKTDCDRKFQSLLKNKDQKAQRLMLKAENKRLTALTAEFKKMETDLKTRIASSGKKNSKLVAELKRIQLQGKKLQQQAKKARQETEKILSA